MKHCCICGREIEHGIKMGKRIKCRECAFEPFGSIMGEKLKEKMEETERGKGR